MSKKLLFNSGGTSIIDVPFENGAIGNVLYFPSAFGNLYFIGNQFSSASLKLQYLTGENAGYVDYTPNINGYATLLFFNKDGSVLFRSLSSNIPHITIVFEDKFKITKLSNLQSIKVRLEE